IAYSGSFPRPRRPVSALLFVARREVPNAFCSSRPSGPGASDPALCPAPRVLSTPRCAYRDKRGRRKAKTSNTRQTPMITAMVIQDSFPWSAQLPLFVSGLLVVTGGRPTFSLYSLLLRFHLLSMPLGLLGVLLGDGAVLGRLVP